LITRGIAAMATAICVHRDLLNYSALVTAYCPEYGRNRKESTTVADLLSHPAMDFICFIFSKTIYKLDNNVN
jgi:CubicO group peptidase (beta-lactamase class C family)